MLVRATSSLLDAYIHERKCVQIYFYCGVSSFDLDFDFFIFGFGSSSGSGGTSGTGSGTTIESFDFFLFTFTSFSGDTSTTTGDAGASNNVLDLDFFILGLGVSSGVGSGFTSTGISGLLSDSTGSSLDLFLLEERRLDLCFTSSSLLLSLSILRLDLCLDLWETSSSLSLSTLRLDLCLDLCLGLSDSSSLIVFLITDNGRIVLRTPLDVNPLRPFSSSTTILAAATRPSMSVSDKTGRLILCVRNMFDVEFACEKYFIAFVCLSATNISVGVLFDTTSSTGGKNVIIPLVDTFENGTFIAVGAFIVSRKLFSTFKGGFISSTTRDVFGVFFLYLRLR